MDAGFQFFTFYLVRLYHGTVHRHAANLDKIGLQPSSQGRLGPGIYLAQKDVATAVATSQNKDKSIYMVEVEVDVGNMKYQGEQDDWAGKWNGEGYDSCHGIHWPWEGVSERSFPEWCIPATLID